MVARGAAVLAAAVARRLVLGCLWGLLCLWGTFAWAGEPQASEVTLQRNPDGLFLTARLSLEETPPAVEDALLRGVPLYFVWRADVFRDRWYWTDKRVSSTVRTLRLAYQPLTRRWRLSLAPAAASTGASLQYAVHQSFDSFDESLRAVMRVVRWPLAQTGDLDEAARHRVELSFRLELSLLPRPFQIGLVNQPDWDIDFRRTLPVGQVVEPVPALASPPADAPLGAER